MYQNAATTLEIPCSAFNYTVQINIDTLSSLFEKVPIGFDRFDHLVMEAIRFRTNEFSYWPIIYPDRTCTSLGCSRTSRIYCRRTSSRYGSLADSAYVGNDCLVTTRWHKATPMLKIKNNDMLVKGPETFFEKLVSFAKHWPKRFVTLTMKHAHSEAVFSMIDAMFSFRLR